MMIIQILILIDDKIFPIINLEKESSTIKKVKL